VSRSTPRRSARGPLAALLAAGVLALSGCGAAAGAEGGEGEHAEHGAPAQVEGPDDTYAGIDLPEPYQRPSFTLTDTAGESYDFAEQTGGAPTLLFFGYTNCPDICPTTLADVAVALRQTAPEVAEQVQMVFVTTDVKRDTPEVLAEYLGRFDADLGTEFVGLTGTQEEIDRAQLAAGVQLAQADGEQHSALLLLYTADDEAPVAFDAGNTPQDIAADLALVVGG
jgi:protein SCO1